MAPITTLPATIHYQTKYGETPADYDAASENGKIILSENMLPVLTYEPMKFNGWSYNGELVHSGDSIDAENPILVAVWEDCFVISGYTELKEIADQLRALMDKTEDMSLGEMAAEASSANSHKTDIMFALSEKGVDTTGAGLADIATLVSAIGAGRVAVKTGMLTMASDDSNVTITHDLGEVPYFFAIFQIHKSGFTTSPSYAVSALWGFLEKPIDDGYSMWAIQGTSYTAFSDTIDTTNNGRPLYNATETTIKTRRSSYTLPAGFTYYWLAIGGLT